MNSSFPDGLNSETYGNPPQPTNRSPPGVVCPFPLLCATWPSGWSSDLTSVATRVARSSRTVTTRLEPSRLPPDSSSKTVYSLPPMASGSCCQAKIFHLGPGFGRGGAEAEGTVPAAELPHDLAGVPVHLENGPGVPGVDQQIAVGVQVDGIDVEPVPGPGWGGRPRHVAVGVGDVGGASHWNSTRPVLMSISWTRPSMTRWSAGPPMAVRFAVVTVSAGIRAVSQGVMRNSWKSVEHSDRRRYGASGTRLAPTHTREIKAHMTLPSTTAAGRGLPRRQAVTRGASSIGSSATDRLPACWVSTGTGV